MIRAALLAVVVIAVPGAYLLTRNAGDRVRFADRYPAVRACRTTDEVVAVMGCPPGRYAKTGVAFIGPLDISGNVWTSGELLSWTGDDGLIVVRKRRDGSVVHTWLVEPVRSRGWFDFTGW
jgi:hypothetical protein